MVIYADILLCINALADYCLLLATAALCRLPKRRPRIAAAAGTGALFSLTLLLPPLPTAAAAASSALCAVLCCTTAFGRLPLRRLMHSTAVFYLCSSAFAGLVFLLSQRSANFVCANGSIYIALPPSLLLGVTVLFYLLQSAFELFFAVGSEEYTGQLRLSTAEGTVTCSCICDSGNTLTEPISGRRAVLIKRSIAAKLLSEEQFAAAQAVLRGDAPAASGAAVRLLPCSTVAGQCLLPCFAPDASAQLLWQGRSYPLCGSVFAVCEDKMMGSADAIAFLP